MLYSERSAQTESVTWWVLQSWSRTNQYACATVMNLFASNEAISVIYTSVKYARLMVISTSQSLVA